MFPLQNTGTLSVLKHASFTTSQSATGLVDTLGYDSVAIDVVLDTAANTTNVMSTLKLEECDTSNGSFATWANAQGVASDATAFVPTIAQTDGSVFRFNVDARVRKRYLKVTVTPAVAQIIGVSAVVGKAEVASEARAESLHGTVDL